MISWRLLFIVLLFSCGSAETTSVDTSESDIHAINQVVSFVYHRFGDSRYPSTNIGLADFKNQLEFLEQNGFEFITVSQAITHLKQDTVRKKLVALTIDDGFKSFKNALPLLKQYNATATLFINTKSVGGSDYLNWEELSEVVEEGIEIGNHTHSHAYFLSLDSAKRYGQFREELNQSQKLIRENLDVNPEVVAYPYGEWDTEMKQIVEKMGFSGAVAQHSGVMHSSNDVYALPRFPMAEAYSSSFKEKALMNPLVIANKQPRSGVLREKPFTELTFSVPRNKYNIPTLQCFLQGGTCEVKITEDGDSLHVKVISKSTAIRRRTLCALTVKDSMDNWHWFSHLWIRPDIKE